MLDMPVRVLDSYAHQLSGGMKQRLITVISTLQNPRLLIADEPTSALDVSSQRMLVEMLLAMVEQRIMSGVVFVTHDLPVLSQVSDRLAIMNAGRIIETGPTRQLVEHPQHDYTRTLLSSVLDPSHETRERGRRRAHPDRGPQAPTSETEVGAR
jgi:peptide/nickel transport system ATP-binding protein